MGKKGEALRAAKMENVKYTFTKAQLMEHDKHVIEAEKPRLEERTRQYARQVVEEEWAKREALMGDKNSQDRFMDMLSYLLCVSSRVLIEKFGWKPIPKDTKVTNRNHTYKFANCLIDELNRICDDDRIDIRDYSDETYRKYGIKFDRTEEADG